MPRNFAAAHTAFPPADRLAAAGAALPHGGSALQHLFARMAEERAHPRPHSDMLLGAYLIELVVLLARAAEVLAAGRERDADSAAARVRPAIELIHDNIDRKLTLAMLARDPCS